MHYEWTLGHFNSKEKLNVDHKIDSIFNIGDTTHHRHIFQLDCHLKNYFKFKKKPAQNMALMKFTQRINVTDLFFFISSSYSHFCF